ncbi:DUF4136 domain-containing protein [Shewanella sp. FJAT-52076]|uniref:DUF4136 domain-containing protein n=1 Tax=Shewanella sp. FJAT-52076 TaxID=2864202 RepID=UPI001C655C7B|nr:DUF4136 domain-containing protein [Shewanella sp. FJAT-52076]QYJ74572.1 DUF4136 domain-containing protein [Shewanella sp. FJAT-52076]
MLRTLTLTLALLSLAACQSGPKTDYDPNTNFAAMKHFALQPPEQTNDPLSSEHIAMAVTQTLMAKGMSQSDTPDFRVTWVFQTGTKPPSSGLSIGLGTGSWGHSGGVSVGTSVGLPLGGEKQYQQIQIDILTASGDRLLWRGSDNFEFSDGGEDKAEATQKTVAKILAAFPPTPK